MEMGKQTEAYTPKAVGRRRTLIFDVWPRVDDGRYPAKRIAGDRVSFECDLVTDGHDKVAGVLGFQSPESARWEEVPLALLVNDRWGATLVVESLGIWRFRFSAWVDEFASLRYALTRKYEAGQDVTVELMSGEQLVRVAIERASGDDRAQLSRAAERLSQGETDERIAVVLSTELGALMGVYPDRSLSTESAVYSLAVEPLRARYSSWYELFPRSFGKGGAHGTFRDVEAVVPYVAAMGFDVLYLPPIHPIGRTFRKGPNNSLQATENDPGSPWAIGATEGGHKDIHPELGTVDDFKRLVARANEHGLEVALDIAFQASPDHPYVKQHPEWFQHRADGTIQYAENPPKKYQDVYPFDLAGANYASLWDELRSVFEVWIERGVRVFRVDNPHTKPIRFWEYCIAALKAEHPDVIFLAEAFTRPKLMYALAKVGFSQSYTYFTWRTTAYELKSYLQELTRTEVSEYFRPNFWPNTPDILPEHLQHGGRPMFVARMVLAGTLSASWGIYGPAFELMEHVPRPGSEEYIDNEKYQLRRWNLERADSLRPVIQRFNAIRRENRALQRNDTLVFHHSDNDNVLAYSKVDEATSNVVLMVVSLEPHHRHSAWLHLDLTALLVSSNEVFQVHDLMTDARYQWHGQRVYVEIDPSMPAHVFRLRRRLRTEHNFEYYL